MAKGRAIFIFHPYLTIITSQMIKVTCALIVEEDKVLIAQRSEQMNMPLKWEFPGGKIEGDEYEEACLQREIWEELNLKIELIQRLKPIIHKYPGNVIELIPFLCRRLSNNLCLKEHKEVKWEVKENLRNYDWAEADIPIVEQFILRQT